MSNLPNKEQLEILGFENNEVWHRNREMLGYIDGEDIDTWFLRKHGYEFAQHEIEKTKKNLTLEERIQKLENPFKEQHEKLRVDGVFLTIFPWHHKNYKGWNLENGVLTSTDKSKGYAYTMPKEFTLFAVLKKDDKNLLLSYMHNSSNNYDWETSKFSKQLHITTLNKDGIFTSYSPLWFEPDITFKNTKIPDISILHGMGSIYDIIVYSHVKSEAEITKIGNLLKDIHNLQMLTVSDVLKGLTKQVKGIAEQHLLVQKQISTINTRIGKNHPLKPNQKLLNALK